MDIIVRKSTEADCNSILTMIKELASFLGHKDDVKITADALIVDGFGENPWYFSLLAETIEDNVKKTVGFVLYYKTYSTWHGKSFFMEDIYIQEAYRRKGLGQKFLKEVVKHALSEGADKVCWNAMEWNTAAREFYKNTGAEMHDDWNVFSLPRIAMEKFVQVD